MEENLLLRDMLLVKIYEEHQKDRPDMEKNVSFKELEIDKDIYNVTLEGLQNDGFIKGVRFAREGVGSKIGISFINSMIITKDGINYLKSISRR